MAEVIFNDLKIQVGDRIKIPKPVVDTLEFQTGDEIILKFDAEKQVILIEKRNLKNKKRSRR